MADSAATVHGERADRPAGRRGGAGVFGCDLPLSRSDAGKQAGHIRHRGGVSVCGSEPKRRCVRLHASDFRCYGNPGGAWRLRGRPCAPTLPAR
jgi:hypothetical protein